MAGLDPAIHEGHSKKDVDARVKPGHDDSFCGPSEHHVFDQM
jgi:hypothetical protein